VLATTTGLAGAALADPCRAALPKPGATFAGAVRYVGDGDSLCVGPGPDPATWIEVRLADFYAPELHAPGGAAAKQTLSGIALNQRVVCSAQHRSYDRIVAVCTLGRRSVGELMRRAGVSEGGAGR
jgi:endonuclease YncB( thermonuclease family)